MEQNVSHIYDLADYSFFHKDPSTITTATLPQ